MALYINDPEVDALAGKLAAAKKLTKLEAVREALEHELEAHEARGQNDQSLATLAKAWRESTVHAVETVDRALRHIDEARHAVRQALV